MNRCHTVSLSSTLTVVWRSVPKFTIRFASSSTSVTVAVRRAPGAYPAGSVPNPSCTLSPPSVSASSVAVTVNVITVWLVPNVTVAGMPAWSAAVAPFRCAVVSGIVTDADGAALSATVTVAAAPPSVAVYEEAPNVTVVWPVVSVTTAVAALVSVSGLLASSVKLTFTLIVVPRSAVTSVWVLAVAPEMFVSVLSVATRIHWYV